jgi:hypothetical protein
MRELLDVAENWDKLSELQKIRLAVVVLVETEPIIKYTLLALHLLGPIVAVVLAVLHRETILAVYVCAQVAIGAIYHRK